MNSFEPQIKKAQSKQSTISEKKQKQQATETEDAEIAR